MRLLSRTGNHISSNIGKAIADYNLIEDKDKILVAVSGGKDSLALLHLLNERKKWAPVSYELIAMHIETDFGCGVPGYKKKLIKFFKDRKIKYHFAKIKVAGKDKKESCFWCSWNRRKELFLAADRLGCNKVAMGHHKDDIIETLLLNMFFQGEFAAMNPRQELFKGKLTIIRPLCYVEEAQTRKYASELKFPSQKCRCLSSMTSNRRVMKGFIDRMEKVCPHVRTNLLKSISRVKQEYIGIK